MWSYLISILIFYIIIKASIEIAKVFLDGKGRLEKIKTFNEGNKRLSVSILVICCVPVFRTIVVISIYYLCFCKDKQFNEMIKNEKE